MQPLSIKLLPCVLLSVFALVLPNGPCGAGEAKDLKASLALLPGLADTPEKGAFVAVVKAMGEVYPDGKISIELFPFARSMDNVLHGRADFHIPCFRNPEVDQSKLPYSTVTVKIGTLCMVIYSNEEKPMTAKLLTEAIADYKNGKAFPYKIEGAAGIESQYPFPVISSAFVDQSLKKTALKRIDAVVWAQEECDLTIKAFKLGNIHREAWRGFEDVIVIANGPEGERINTLLSSLLNQLRDSGKLADLYSKIHLPYNDWQPSKMGWPVYAP
jgi:polar amino acid transport system substrate-binding protein